ncbi:hypothetical protein SAMN04488028_101755 [Reichenbachiella agariperforans]|uniref:Uncharacterized protein n=1 Tax=Reichenbachiella agariperforans TaxID=156994 RepID=A0A1M6KYL7_REIAG|nr:hypothetical protein SAMN04488028_101755 [Reichenbachiella agariperforans]
MLTTQKPSKKAFEQALCALNKSLAYLSLKVSLPEPQPKLTTG